MKESGRFGIFLTNKEYIYSKPLQQNRLQVCDTNIYTYIYVCIYIHICSLRRKAIMYSGNFDRIWSPFSTQIGTDFSRKCYAFLNILRVKVYVQKYDLYNNCRKKCVLYFKCCTRAFCCIIFNNVFSDNVNNLYKSILLIISFLFSFI